MTRGSLSSYHKSLEATNEGAAVRAVIVAADCAIAAAENSVEATTGSHPNPAALIGDALAMGSATSVYAEDAVDETTRVACWDAVQIDCAFALENPLKQALSLWPDGKGPIESQWLEVKAKASAPEWAFWIKWYQDLLDGVQPDWDLLERIALIDDAVWNAGPKAVAVEIAKIEKQFELLREVRAFKASAAEVKAATASVAHRSHNQPPELVEVESELTQRFELIWDALDEAETELEKPQPEPSRLRAIADKLLELVIATTKYCASLADGALKKAAEEIGTSGTKWAVRGVAAMWAVQQEPIRGFAGGLKDFVEMLLR